MWLLPTFQKQRNDFVFSGFQKGQSLIWPEPFTLHQKLLQHPFTAGPLHSTVHIFCDRLCLCTMFRLPLSANYCPLVCLSCEYHELYKFLYFLTVSAFRSPKPSIAGQPFPLFHISHKFTNYPCKFLRSVENKL